MSDDGHGETPAWLPAWSRRWLAPLLRVPPLRPWRIAAVFVVAVVVDAVQVLSGPHGWAPSEASGFQWRHIDLRRGIAHVRQSYHMGKYGKPKTKTAKRTIELHPETVNLLRALKPLREEPEAPVFLTHHRRPD